MKKQANVSLVAWIVGLFLLTPALVFAQSAPSVSLQSLSPGSSVPINNEVSFAVVTSGFGVPSYAVSDSFSGSSVSNNDFNNGGVFTWIPVASDAGTHTLTITVTDPQGDSASATQQITVNGPPAVSIQSLSPSASVTTSQTITFSAVASGVTSPSYSVGDSFSNSSLTSNAINSSGYFSWTPLPQDIGTHTITVTANGSSGSATASQTITVSGTGSLSIQSLAPSTSLTLGQSLTFSVVSSGLTNPNYIVSDSFSGSTVSSADINSSGYFSWTPTASDTGTHALTVSASDSSGNTANTSVVININSTATTASSGLSQSQIQSVLSLLQSFGVNQATITNVSAVLNGQATASTPVASAPGYVFSNFLNIGSTGTDVTELQQHLASLGIYTGPVTGYYGPLTKTAVEHFQKVHGISQVGYVGPSTRTALNQ